MQRVLVIVSVIVLVTASLGVGALAANWPFWRRAWAWHAADGGWPLQLPGPHQTLRGGDGVPLQFEVAAADLTAAAARAETQLLLRVRGGVADAWRAPGADESAPVDGHGLAAALLAPLFMQLEARHPGLLERPIGAWIEAWRQDQRGALTPRELLELIAAGIGEPPAATPLNPFSARARLASGPGFQRAAQLAFTASGEHRAAAAAQLLASVAAAVEGRPFADVLQTGLWARIASADASVMLDRRLGVAAAHCCIRAAPADWLRLGLHLSQAAHDAPTQVLRSAGRALVASPDGAIFWMGQGPAPSGLEMLLQSPGAAAILED